MPRHLEGQMEPSAPDPHRPLKYPGLLLPSPLSPPSPSEHVHALAICCLTLNDFCLHETVIV